MLSNIRLMAKAGLYGGNLSAWVTKTNAPYLYAAFHIFKWEAARTCYTCTIEVGRRKKLDMAIIVGELLCII